MLQENYKKQLAVKDEASSLKRQLQEERDSKSQIVVKLQQEHQTAADTEIKKVENRTRILEDERNELLDKVKKLESLQNDLSRSMVNLDKEKTERLEKEKQMVQRIKKYVIILAGTFPLRMHFENPQHCICELEVIALEVLRKRHNAASNVKVTRKREIANLSFTFKVFYLRFY